MGAGFGNIPPFFTNYGAASATSPGILTGPGTIQVIPGNKQYQNTAALQGTLATWTPGAYTGLTASTENLDVNFNLARTVQFATGALATQRAAVFQAPTYSFVGASTITNAATVAIAAAPTAGTNATITNPWALWVQAGGIAIGNGGSPIGSRLYMYDSSGGVPELQIQNSGTYHMKVGLASSNGYVGSTNNTPFNLQANSGVKAVVSSSGFAIGSSGTPLTQVAVYSQSLTPSAVAANTTAEQTFTVTGLTTADKVDINPGVAPTAGTGIAGVRVSAANTLAITFANNTAGSLTPASGTYNVVATRS